MGAVFQRVYVYKREGSGSTSTWSSTPTDLSMYAFDVTVKKGIQNIKDTFSFKLNKAQDYYSESTPIIEYGDLVRIWMKRDSFTFTDSDLLIEGVVNSTPMSFGSNGRILTVKGNDFFETMFDVMLPVSGLEGKQKTWNEILQALMDRLEFKSRNLFWATSANGWSGGDNPTTKYNGDSFPQIDVALNFTPFYKIVEMLTSPENTGDGQYTYRVGYEGGKRFLVITSQQEASELAIIREGTLTEGLKIDKQSDDTKNYVIFNCGNDLYGNPIEHFEVDYDSAGKVGFKYYYMIEETADTADTILQDEAKADGGANFNWSDGRWTSTDHFPLATSYPYTWNTTTLTGATVQSTDNADFNDDLINLALEKGRDRAKQFIDHSKVPKYEETIHFRFRNDFTIGGLYRVVMPSRNIDRLLRVKEATYRLTGVDITFEEDQHRTTL
jgi:hypothetical protein